MAEYLVSDTDLTSVANAIRTKGGTSAPLAFPSGFVSAVENIPSGGGGGLWEEIDVGGSSAANPWDIFVFLDQSSDQMGATASVTIAGTTYSLEGPQSMRYLHFTHVPNGTSISWDGTGDSTYFAWMKIDGYISTQISNSGSFSTTAQIPGHTHSDYYVGTMFLIVASPET